MIKWQRLSIPSVLADKWEEYGNRYAENKAQNPSHIFQWPTVFGQKLNHILLPDLRKQTQAHCSYCDDYPPRIADNTIDHFKPKSFFYKEVCKWENLYFACANCQIAKGEQFDAYLLRPDADDFSFLRYFIYNSTDHTIDVNPQASISDQNRAGITIRIMNLNEDGLKSSRKSVYRKYADDDFIDEIPFRFMF